MKLKMLGLVLALQTAWILGTSLKQEHDLRGGQVVLLETQPVDPRDLLRGDYVILNYKIGSVSRERFSPPVNDDLRGAKVWVALAPGPNQFHEITRASTNKFAPAANEILLCGESAGHLWWGATNAIRIEYGLERYYVAEGTGNPRGKLTVEAVVPASGRASIKQVFLNRQPYAEAMKAAAP